MNNDGLLDIVTSASAADGTLPAVFLGTGVDDGIPRFEAPPGLGSDQYWVAAPTADYNRDGRLDIVLVEWETNTALSVVQRTQRRQLDSRRSQFTDPGPCCGCVRVRGGPRRRSDCPPWSSPSERFKGYAAGSELLVHVGLGTIGEVDVVVTLVDGTRHEALGISANGMYLLSGWMHELIAPIGRLGALWQPVRRGLWLGTLRQACVIDPLSSTTNVDRIRPSYSFP